jgi:hypothetical protein
VDSNGRVLQSYGGSKGSGSGQVNSPVRLAVNGFILVADLNNDRVLMLSPKLTFIREVLTKMRGVLRMSLDVYTGRLYVADCKWENKAWISGQVKVFNIHK